MAEELRLKCNVLAGLTKLNKKKTDTNSRSRSGKRGGDSDSDNSARTKMTKKTGRTKRSGTSKTKSGNTKSKNHVVKDTTGDDISRQLEDVNHNKFEVNMHNTEELFYIVQKCILMKTFYETYKNIKTDTD